MKSSMCALVAMATLVYASQRNNQNRQQIDTHDYILPEGIYDEFKDDEGISDFVHSRSPRFVHRSLVLQPFLNVLRKSPSPNHRPTKISDLFDFLRDDYPLPPGVIAPFREYDFVIVGAGATGCAIASRLSENERWNVLLLEAGGPESLLTDAPLLAAFFQHTDYNWGYRLEKQDGVCLGMDDQKCAWPRGKAVGGSSVINYMIYTRGNRIDWDRIAAAGNPGWSFDEVLPYFLKSEKASNLEGLEKTPSHNRDGLMSVEYIRHKTPLMDAFLEAGKELGNKVVDYNDGETFGFSRIQAQTLNGKRHSAAKAFLHPFKHRRNLHVLPFSRVTKIKIDKDTKTATSVEYVRNKQKYIVKATKEIILSAGALASPQLLMLSGVGPKKHLKELDIPVIQDLAVGENLYDHVSFVGLPFLINTTSIGVTESESVTPKSIVRWLQYGDGPITLVGGLEGIGYIKTKVSEEEADYPDMELLFSPAGIASDASSAVRRGMKVSDSFYNKVYRDINETPLWSIIPMILHPKSKGYMKLKDKNPFHWPKFYYDYFSDKRDLDSIVEAVKYSIRLSKTKAFQKFGSVLYDKHFPTCEEFEFDTDEYWGCAVRTLSNTLHHQIGTCKMGPSTDPEAIVDHELRVHGIKLLRVADTSIIPWPITAHTNAPAVMIGEKLADMLKKTWG